MSWKINDSVPWCTLSFQTLDLPLRREACRKYLAEACDGSVVYVIFTYVRMFIVVVSMSSSANHVVSVPLKSVKCHHSKLLYFLCLPLFELLCYNEMCTVDT